MPLDDKEVLKIVLAQVDTVLAEWTKVYESRVKSGYYEISDADSQALVTRLSAAIERLAPMGSRYRRNADAAFELYQHSLVDNMNNLAGILKALRSDYEAGYLRAVQELIHADIFADFLEMADYFLEQGYKDPSAVIAGGVLEEHLRKLCQKNGLPSEDITSNGTRPKKASTLNDDLAKQSIYSKLEQKNITAWLELRNKAAHGKYGDYTKESVELMIQALRHFIVQFPA